MLMELWLYSWNDYGKYFGPRKKSAEFVTFDFKDQIQDWFQKKVAKMATGNKIDKMVVVPTP